MTRLLLVAAAMLALGAGIARAEVRCPDGAVRAGAEPPDGWSVWCEKGGLHHGPYVMWHADGKPMRKGAMYMGALQGRQRSWFRNGQLAEDALYRNGVRAGIWKRYHRNGKLAARIEYRFGGKPYGIGQWWHGNGKLARKAWYRDGKPYRELFWDEEGNRTEPPAPMLEREAKSEPRRMPTRELVRRNSKLRAPVPVTTLREASAFVDGTLLNGPACGYVFRAVARLRQEPFRRHARLDTCDRHGPRATLCMALARDFHEYRVCFRIRRPIRRDRRPR